MFGFGFGNMLRVKMKRRKMFLFLALLTSFLIYLFDVSMLDDRKKDVVDENNYLEMKGPKAMLIDLPGCIIPLEIEELEQPKLTVHVCDTNRPQFTFIRANRLFINATYKYVSCCYRGIQRKFGTDDEILLEKDCVKIAPGNVGTTVSHLFDSVIVICDYGDSVFDDFHAVVHKKSGFNLTLANAFLNPTLTTTKSAALTSHLQKTRENNLKSLKFNLNKLPKTTTYKGGGGGKEGGGGGGGGATGQGVELVTVPNILMIGLDSVSRFHFHKLMPKTKELLEQLGSIEMLGYTKVGENTFPNAIVFSTGYSEDEVKQFCYNRSRPIDDCPFVWNGLNMNTAILEDAPRLAIFNYYKFGFFNPPADHYLRPLMLAAGADYYPFTYSFPCIGSRPVEKFILDHMEQLLLTESPIFVFSWLTALAHENVDNLPAADLLFSDFFQKLNLSNTVVILMSDHGHRYGDGRRSFNGWFNEKLPFFTITLPPRVKKFLGERRLENLEANVKKLTTPFEVYHTLYELLTAYGVKDKEAPQSPASSPGANNNSNNSSSSSSTSNPEENHPPPHQPPAQLQPQHQPPPSPPPFPRSHGQSLFSVIPAERSCTEAGIPHDFCACYDLQGMSMRDPLIELTVRHALTRINKWTPKRCKRLEISQINAGARLNDEEFIVGFTTKPGDFKFETLGRYDGRLLNPRITRTNRIEGVWCLNDWFLEFYCYCDVIGLVSEFLLGK